jgi:hypothetical protein
MDERELLRVVANALRLAEERTRGAQPTDDTLAQGLLPPLPIPRPRLPDLLPDLLPDRFPWEAPPPQPYQPVMGYGPVKGAAIAGHLARPVPVPLPPRPPRTTPLFNPNVALDPSQVEDRRGWRYPHPGERPEEPPFFMPWRQDEYRQRLREWQAALGAWEQQQRQLRDYENYR